MTSKARECDVPHHPYHLNIKLFVLWALICVTQAKDVASVFRAIPRRRFTLTWSALICHVMKTMTCNLIIHSLILFSQNPKKCNIEFQAYRFFSNVKYSFSFLSIVPLHKLTNPDTRYIWNISICGLIWRIFPRLWLNESLVVIELTFTIGSRSFPLGTLISDIFWFY